MIWPAVESKIQEIAKLLALSKIFKICVSRFASIYNSLTKFRELFE